MVDNYSTVVSEEVFAAWLDGTMSQDEDTAFQMLCASNTDMQEILDANDQIDEDFEYMVEVGYALPYELKTEFEIPQIAIYDDEEEVFSYEDESYSQEDSEEGVEQTCQEEDNIDYMNNSSLVESDMNEIELI